MKRWLVKSLMRVMLFPFFLLVFIATLGLTAAQAATLPPTLLMAFGSSGTTSSSLNFTITNPNASTQLTGVGFNCIMQTSPLPSLTVSTPDNGLTGSCGGGSIVATAGSGAITLTGATLAANASCAFSVNVTAVPNNDPESTAYMWPVVTAGPVNSNEGGTGNSAMASLNPDHFITSTRTIYHTTNTAVSQRVDTFSTEIIGRMQGGPTLYDQTFNVAYADPAVQAAVATVKGVLTGGGAASISGPALLSSGTSLVSSIPQTGAPVVTGTDVSVATTTYIGPQTIMIGENQQTAFNLRTGQADIDTLVTSDVHQTITTTTTDTYLTTEKYELVGVAPATHFTVTAPATATAGAAFNVTVTALDQFNNTVTGYSGTVHFTSSDGAAVLPANATLINGTGTFSATLNTVGSRTITATDTVTASITGASGNITVSAAPATHFTVSAPATATAGASFNFTVTALDQSNATVTGYSGTVHFTSSDGAALLPGNSTLTNGVGTFSATLNTVGTRTITATDTVTASITGASGNIVVSAAGTAPSITCATSATFTVGDHGTFTVTATGSPTPALSEAGALPGGVTFIDNGNGSATLSGTPAEATGGVYHLTLTAHNSAGPDAIQGFTLTVLDSASLVLNVSTLPDGAVITGAIDNVNGGATTPWPWPSVNGLFSGVILNVSGFAASPDGIQSVTYNGAALSLAADGGFSFPALLASGPNTITIVAIDKTGHQSASSRTITLSPTGPALTVTSPADGAATQQTTVTVTGTTSANATVAARVNNGAAQAAAQSGAEFTVTVNLDTGMNTIELTATDLSNAKNSVKLTLVSDPAGLDLAVTTPDRDIITADSALTLSGTVSSSAPPVTVNIACDGKTFTPVVTNGAFQQTLTLAAEKAYAIVVTATDANAQTSAVQRNVIYSMTASGDINGDGQVDIGDALLALKSAVNLMTPATDEVRRGDVAPLVNGTPVPDGKIDIQDALLILRKAVGLGW